MSNTKTPTFDTFIKEGVKQGPTFHDALEAAQKAFREDPTVKAAYETISKKHNEIVEKEFSKVEPSWSDSDNFIEFNEGFYESKRDDRPDELSLFDLLWFTN